MRERAKEVFVTRPSMRLYRCMGEMLVSQMQGRGRGTRCVVAVVLLVACSDRDVTGGVDAGVTDAALRDGTMGVSDARAGDAGFGEPSVGPVASLSAGAVRRGAALAQLPDGRVFVAGGIPEIATIELYDVEAGTIAAVDSLNEGRRYASATVLPDGTVLVLGGAGAATDGTSAEIFDPADGSSTLLVQRMSVGRAGHGAWLLSSGSNAGKVLVAGGAPSAAPELYDPATKTFSSLGASSAPPASPGSVVLLRDERVMYLGAASADGMHQRDCYLYDAATGVFAQVASLAHARNRYQPVVLVDGRVLVAGGYDDEQRAAVVDVEMFDPSSGDMTTLPVQLPGPRYLFSAALLGSGRVALVSGVAAPSSLLATVGIFDPQSNSVSAARGEVGVARASSSALSLADGRVFVLGGQIVVGVNTFDVSNVDLISE